MTANFAGPILSPREKSDILEIIDDWLGSNDFHDIDPEMDFDSLVDYENFVSQYNRIGKLYFVFTGRDYLCGHGYISNYEGRDV